MVAAHQRLLDALALSPPEGLTIDLGCGNGYLLQKIANAFAVLTQGIEVDRSRAGVDPSIIIADLRDFAGIPQADTYVVSQRRFEEIPGLEAWCFAHARQVLVYSYDEPMFVEMRAA